MERLAQVLAAEAARDDARAAVRANIDRGMWLTIGFAAGVIVCAVIVVVLWWAT